MAGLAIQWIDKGSKHNSVCRLTNGHVYPSNRKSSVRMEVRFANLFPVLCSGNKECLLISAAERME
jgi:hypothetical protein